MDFFFNVDRNGSDKTRMFDTKTKKFLKIFRKLKSIFQSSGKIDRFDN